MTPPVPYKQIMTPHNWIFRAPHKQSNYALRMLKLSGRIFGEYIRPALPNEFRRTAVASNAPAERWESEHYQNEQVVRRCAEKPEDLRDNRNSFRYPPHPQIRDLMITLRDHGLYRDEHQDIKEEMARQRALKGKPDVNPWTRESRKKNDGKPPAHLAEKEAAAEARLKASAGYQKMLEKIKAKEEGGD